MNNVPTPDLPAGRQVQLPSGTQQALSQMLSQGTGALRLAATNIDSQLDADGNAIQTTPGETALAQALNDFAAAIDPWVRAYQAAGC